MITTDVTAEEKKFESSLRPQLLKDYIGQEKIKANLKVYIDAAKARGESLDHVLFYGPPGLGKTTLSGIIANEMGVNMKVTSGPAIEKPGEMAAILNNLKEGDVLFVDEIHRLNRQVEEVLYPAMEDYCIDIMIGRVPRRAPCAWICRSSLWWGPPQGRASDGAAAGPVRGRPPSGILYSPGTDDHHPALCRSTGGGDRPGRGG